MNRTLRQLGVATLMELRVAQRELGIVLGFVVLFPLGFLLFLGLLVRPDLLVQVVVGSVMMEMALLNVNALAQTVGNDKESKMYDLWVSLPVSPVVYLVAKSLSLLPFSLLSAVVTLGVGAAVFGFTIPMAALPLVLLAFVLVWASTIGVGFFIGVYGRTPRQINNVAQFVGIVMTFFAPVFYPLAVLPRLAQYLAEAWPLTWGALLLRALLDGNLATAAVPAGVLGAFTLLWFGAVAGGLRWRQT